MGTAKKILKIFIVLIELILALLLLAIVVLNLMKFLIYQDYYRAEAEVCRNPGIHDGFVCQGIAADEDEGVIMVSGYMMDDKDPSRIYITDLNNNSYHVDLYNDEKPYTGHAGGIAIADNTVFIAGERKIYSCPLEDVLNASNGERINIGSGTTVNNQASYLYSDDEYLYVGSFVSESTKHDENHIFQTAEGTHYAICSQYLISDLSAPVKVFSVRDKVQGVCFMPDGRVVMSTSWGLTSSDYYIYDLKDAVKSGEILDGAPVYYLDKVICEVMGPAMAEGLDYFNGKVITLSESASNKYIYGKVFFANDIISLDIDYLCSNL